MAKKNKRPQLVSPHAPKFLELLELKPNWDSYHAKEIDVQSAINADMFLNKHVNIIPTVSGGIQLEWHVHGLDIEISFDKDGIVGAMVAYDRPRGKAKGKP